MDFDPFASDPPRDLFEGEPLPRVAVPLAEPLMARRAVLHTTHHLTCDTMTIAGPKPITMLCGALRALGEEDSDILIVDRAGMVVMTIRSFYAAAAVGGGEI